MACGAVGEPEEGLNFFHGGRAFYLRRDGFYYAWGLVSISSVFIGWVDVTVSTIEIAGRLAILYTISCLRRLR